MNLSKKLKDANINFVKKNNIFLIVSACIVFVSIIILCIFGMNLGIDFTGGTAIKVVAGNTLETASGYEEVLNRVESKMEVHGLSIASHQKEGDASESYILVKYQDIAGKSVEEMYDISTNLVNDLRAEFGDEITISTADRITATASSRLIWSAVLAVVIACVLITVYTIIRFKSMISLCGIIGIIHDVLLVLGLSIICRLEIGSVFIAALITVVAYSINNNIVIFDRIRENKNKYEDASNPVIVNKSIAQSLIRTSITTITTLIAIISIACIGVVDIINFAIPIIIGVICSLYSSTFIVSPIWARISDRKSNVKKQQKDVEIITK